MFQHSIRFLVFVNKGFFRLAGPSRFDRAFAGFAVVGLYESLNHDL